LKIEKDMKKVKFRNGRCTSVSIIYAIVFICAALGYSCEQNANSEWKWVEGPASGKAKTDNSEKLIPKEEDGKWGYVNQAGEWVVPPQFSVAEEFSFGVGKAILVYPYPVFFDVHGIEIIKTSFKISGMFGGNMTITGVNGYECNGIKLEDIGNFSEGYLAARSGGKWGYLRRTGSWAVKPQFEKAGDFRNGVAKVKLGDKEGYIVLKMERW
jgi:hypothetical protein